MNKKLINKVKKYFEYLNDEDIDQEEAYDFMIQKLSSNLKREVKWEINGKLMK